MANSGGGTIKIGFADDGTRIGLDEELAAKFDSSVVGDLLDRFISPDRIEVGVELVRAAGSLPTVVLDIPAFAEPPLVLSKVGNVRSGKKHDTVFPQNAVYVRRNTKAEPARQADYRAWSRDAARRERESILANLTLVMNAPAETKVQLVDDSGPHDPPSMLLSQATDIFEHRPEKLLSGADLGYLWLNRAALSFERPGSASLVIQSALRKRSTLYPWLWLLTPDESLVASILNETLELKDRDKSDAARSILNVAALYLDESGYQELRAKLADSGYAHMTQAADQWPTRVEALPVVNEEMSAKSEVELVEAVDNLVATSGARPPKTIGDIGLALLQKRL